MRATTASRVRAKRVYETTDAVDGWRILVTQYWPRGISRESVDEYVRVLGPSRELLAAYRSGQISWTDYRMRFLDEMDGEAQRAEIHRLAKLARSETITILCVCDDPEKCHRWLLRDLIARFDDD
ncbi:MAG TPA: DUF488 family protein [Dehalococcoidia bacterium]|nr:DUF488 family protein [Dehalococcoidia bacterium]